MGVFPDDRVPLARGTQPPYRISRPRLNRAHRQRPHGEAATGMYLALNWGAERRYRHDRCDCGLLKLT